MRTRMVARPTSANLKKSCFTHLALLMMVLAGSATDHKIIRVIDDVGIELILVPVVAPGQQKAPEVEIGQHRAYYRALWRSSLRPPGRCCTDHAPSSPLHDRNCQPALDDAEQASVGDTAAQASHQRTVRNCREVVAQIRVDDLPPSVLPDVPKHLAYGHLGIQLRPETILVGQHVRLEDRANHQHHRHLDHPVTNGRNAERPLPAVTLWNPHSQQGLRAVSATA
jgi:hypothetical protein